MAWVNCCSFPANKVVYKHVSMTSLFPLRKPTHPQSVMFIYYGFLLELWVLNLVLPIIAEYINNREDLVHPDPYIQNTTVFCDMYLYT